MRGRVIRALGGLMVAFALLFALGLVRAADRPGDHLGLLDASKMTDVRKNYASNRWQKKGEGAAPTIAVDQKYEKIATLAARTRRFERDEQSLRAAVSSHHALIQFERSAGLPPQRQLELSIGVPPDQFDAMLDEVRKVGQLSAIQIDKTDKTNEYKDLRAHRISLEKARDALIAVKGHGGRLEEQINLEGKILEYEESIQKLGVRLGEYDAENEFVTIQCTLREIGAPVQASLLHRVREALEWAVEYYLLLLLAGLLAALFALAAIHLVEKIRRLARVDGSAR